MAENQTTICHDGNECAGPDFCCGKPIGTPSPREMIDWLAFSVGARCEKQEDHIMYMAIRDVIVQHFGMAAGVFRFGDQNG